MAFQTPLDLGNGIILNFHVVTSVLLDYERNSTQANLRSYVDKAYAEKSDDKSVQGNDYTFPGIPVGDPQDFVYQELKKRPEWSGAAEVEEPAKPTEPSAAAEPEASAEPSTPAEPSAMVAASVSSEPAQRTWTQWLLGQ